MPALSFFFSLGSARAPKGTKFSFFPGISLRYWCPYFHISTEDPQDQKTKQETKPTPARRIEDKLDALNIQSELFMIRMAAAPGQKHVPLQFPGWICMQEDCVADNLFRTSQLLADRWGVQPNPVTIFSSKNRVCFFFRWYQCRCTRANINWLPESSYVVPAAGKDMTPSSAETRPHQHIF